MFERLCYYGMRGLLILYLAKALLLGDARAIGIYGAYTALVFAAPVWGGKLADTVLGYKRAVAFGGVVMASGLFFILGGTEFWLFLGMSTIIIGNGYFKANISTLVGKLYWEGDPRRDSGFTIFYMGINIGSFTATLLCGWLGETYGWSYGFGAAGIGMIIGLITFTFGQKYLRGHAEPTEPEKLKKRFLGPVNVAPSISLLSLPVAERIPDRLGRQPDPLFDGAYEERPEQHCRLRDRRRRDFVGHSRCLRQSAPIRQYGRLRRTGAVSLDTPDCRFRRLRLSHPRFG